MDAPELILTLERRGLRLYPESGRLIVEPAHLLTDADRAAIRAHKAAIVTMLARPADWELTKAVTMVEQSFPGSRFVEVRHPHPARTPASPADLRAAWPRSVAPNSRSPLIPPEVRSKIEAIEGDARAKGWPPELLWNSGFWDCPRGLAAVLDPDDEIAEVTPDFIAILKTRRDLLRFRRVNA